MSTSNSMFLHSSQNFFFAEDKSLKEVSVNLNANNVPETANVNTNASTSKSSEVLQCFVCDAQVQGRHYSLASCRTQSTRARVVEKLGELVGEKYMVVISEDDVICRSCANLINTLDRLETEIKSVKGAVLRYLEHKYSLDDGELQGNSKPAKPSQPTYITPRYQSFDNDKKRKPDVDESAQKKKKKPVWLQCDKCKYTTNYNTFMIHHIRQHVNHKINCDKCGVQFIGNNQQNNSHNCREKQKPTKNAETVCGDKSNTETLLNTNGAPLETENLVQNSFPLIIAEDQDQHQDGQSEFILEQVNTVGDLETPLMVESEDLVLQKKDFSMKQILTVGEDGSLEMMEMDAWEEKNAASTISGP